ncbi:uncharacterized protein pon [Drosophila tropicalis]|uniref:uncharacterized protein pon n=1 Tax=Drosophila tropicalis TaxID=46794 RepID=UPI0035AC05DB
MLETKSIAALAFNFNDNETPRKRKRETRTTTTTTTTKVTVADPPLAEGKCRGQETGAAANASCFTNAAFSSTPKKIIGRRRLAKENNHGNSNCNPNPNPFPCLEFKSIADLAQQQPTHSTNPFEVVRQPSKKKKREHACFENPGLNLELPEKQFNPYEVVRCAAKPAKGFVNPALNLRGNDTPASLNPFEIHRPSETTALAANRPPTGVENPALADDVVPTNLKIGLPFAPTLGCRIDFHGMALSQLTPSRLLAEKLVFSPVQPAAGPAAKRSLGAISEENSTMDIGKELDRYQLELENSINEAKLRKNGISVESIEYKEQQITLQDDVNGERRSFRCATRRRTLTEINETPETEETEEVSAPTVVQIDEPREDEEELKAMEQLESGDVAYASESEDEEDVADDLKDNLDFKAPMRFVRSYRPAGIIRPEKLKAESKDSLTSIASSKSSKSTTEEKETNQQPQQQQHGHGVKNMIRKSIRRLIHPLSTNQETGSCPAPPPSAPTNIMSSIRHSLRRRQQHQKLNDSPEKQSIADISIVDTSERTMKLRSIIPQTEYMTIEQLTNEKKHTLRNSIRRSTRDVLRHVFHKSHDAYNTAK